MPDTEHQNRGTGKLPGASSGMITMKEGMPKEVKGAPRPGVDTGCLAVINSDMLNHFKPVLRRVLALSKQGCLKMVPNAGRCPAIGLGILAVFSGGSLMSQPAQPDVQLFGTNVSLQSTIVTTNYHGWSQSVRMSNGKVEAWIAPEAGRVMQFRFAGSADGPFWENPKLYGTKSSKMNWNTPGALGGDKAWPAPQSDWPQHTPWSPPFGFDGHPYDAAITPDLVTLTGGVLDEDYQIRVVRNIELHPDQPVMRIRTVFERVHSCDLTNQPISVWVITQVKDVVGIYVPATPQSTLVAADFAQLGRGLPDQFKHENGLISFPRDLTAERHLGFYANSLVWVGTNCAMRIDAPRVPGVDPTNYPNGGCNTVVYTNPKAEAPYVELECFSPLTILTEGQSAELVTTYTLFKRTESNPELEARKILGLPARPAIP
jgi:hypothetical protein